MLTTFGEWWCLRWHKSLSVVERVSAFTDHIRCDKCGREYGMNHDVRAILPWSEVRGFYERLNKFNASATADSRPLAASTHNLPLGSASAQGREEGEAS